MAHSDAGRSESTTGPRTRGRPAVCASGRGLGGGLDGRVRGRANGRAWRRTASRGRRVLRAALVALLLAPVAGCTQIDNFLASIPIFAFMHESPAFDPYEAPRPAPEGAVPFAAPDGAPALPPVEPTEQSLNAFAAEIGDNPVELTEDALAEGQALYLRYCFVCHGPAGQGQGPIVGPGKFPFAPDLTLPTTVQRPDGYIYGITRVGRGLMPAYGPQTTHRERWLIVAYVRQLQEQAADQEAAAAAEGRD